MYLQYMETETTHLFSTLVDMVDMQCNVCLHAEHKEMHPLQGPLGQLLQGKVSKMHVVFSYSVPPVTSGRRTETLHGIWVT